MKLDFLCGLLVKGLEMTGSKDFRGVQTRIGEVITYRHLFWSLVHAMVNKPDVWSDGTVVPNVEAATVYRVMMADAYARVKEIFQQDLASALIYSNSNAVDWQVPELSKYLGEYARGSGGNSAEYRLKVMKLIWDALGTEFGSRHELYERNYAGSYELVRLDTYVAAEANGRIGQFVDFVESCMDEYDTKGWTVPDLINPGDFSVIRKPQSAGQ